MKGFGKSWPGPALEDRRHNVKLVTGERIRLRTTLASREEVRVRQVGSRQHTKQMLEQMYLRRTRRVFITYKQDMWETEGISNKNNKRLPETSQCRTICELVCYSCQKQFVDIGGLAGLCLQELGQCGLGREKRASHKHRLDERVRLGQNCPQLCTVCVVINL